MASPWKHSVSSVRAYEQCPQRWHFKHVKRLKVDTGSPPRHWLKGRVIHAGLEAAFQARSRDGMLSRRTSMGDLWDVASAAVEKSWHDEGLGEPQGHDWHDVHRQVSESLEAVALPAPRDVLGVELRIDTPTAYGTPFLGFIDLLLRVGEDAVLVRDWKSNSRASAPRELIEDFQLAVYSAQVRRLYPWASRVYASHFHTPIAREVRVEIDPETQADATTRFEAVVELSDADEAWQPRPGEHCGTCPFRRQCPAWNADGTALVTDNPALLELDGF